MPAPSTIAHRYIRAGYLGHLNAEWVTSYADRPYPSPTWATHPALEGPTTLQELLDLILHADSTRRDAILHALLSLTAAGDDTAARATLQTMLGTVQWLASTARSRMLEDSASAACEAMWVTIRRYPLHRTGRVAANLKMDALKRLATARRADVPASDDLDERIHRAQLQGRLDDQRVDVIASLGHGVPATDATAVITWAQDRGVLTEVDAQVLALAHLGPMPASLTAIAQHLGLSAAAVRQRHSRAVRKLAEAVRADMAA